MSMKISSYVKQKQPYTSENTKAWQLTIAKPSKPSKALEQEAQLLNTQSLRIRDLLSKPSLTLVEKAELKAWSVRTNKVILQASFPLPEFLMLTSILLVARLLPRGGGINIVQLNKAFFNAKNPDIAFQEKPESKAFRDICKKDYDSVVKGYNDNIGQYQKAWKSSVPDAKKFRLDMSKITPEKIEQLKQIVEKLIDQLDDIDKRCRRLMYVDFSIARKVLKAAKEDLNNFSSETLVAFKKVVRLKKKLPVTPAQYRENALRSEREIEQQQYTENNTLFKVNRWSFVLPLHAGEPIFGLGKYFPKPLAPDILHAIGAPTTKPISVSVPAGI